MAGTPQNGKALPTEWRREAQSRLEPDEKLLATFEPDLDQRLRFSRGLVLLTNRRVLAADTDGRSPDSGQVHWQEWPLAPDTSLRAQEHGGAGVLELVGPDGRLAHWRYTAGRGPEAQRMLARLAVLRATQAGAPPPVDSVCPSCGAPISPEEGRCLACSPEPTTPSVSALGRLLRFARPHLRLIVLGFLFTLASTSVALIPPYLTKPLMDDVLVPHQQRAEDQAKGLTSTTGPVDFSPVPWYLAGMVGAALLAWLLDWGRVYTMARASERVSADLRSTTYAHLQRLSLEFFGGKRTGDLMARIGNDSERLCNFLSINLVDFAADMLMIVMTATILLSTDPLLALAALCPFPIIVWMVARVRGRLLRGYRQAGVAWGAMTSVLADTIPGIRVVKAFAQEQREIERFDHSNERVFHANDRLNRVWAVFSPTVTLLTAGGLLVVWAFGCWRIFDYQIKIGVLTMFLAYITRFYTRTESMIRMASATQRAAASAQRIFEILDRVPSVPEPARPVSPGRLKGSIELRGVHFKYGPREVLHGLDLKIEPGEMVGVVGATGAGKTTLINLICRFYDVAAGAILVDGTDVRSFPVEEYRKNIGIVLQD
ncbi:MAG TPA: ABC transporter transmembrane domain-containing protein, partial [Gemmataceae bacterium]|nr:ABC transporter transmembrane domain-containing protein [Gemmataceae bacterium]